MLFNSYAFILGFLPLALGGFFACARIGRRTAGCWLIAASLVFYGWWTPAFVPLLVASMAGNFVLSRAIGAMERRKRLQLGLLAGGIAANLGALAYYKYLAACLLFLRGHGLTVPSLAAPALPLGISFFTFTQIGYLIDCQQGAARERGALSYALFVTFFPHLIAGPILHHREIMPQFAAERTWRFSAQNVAVGLGIFLIGLLKKCLLADPLAPMVDAGFAHPGRLALCGAWQAALGYSLQLYFDFSGYSDMAIGVARMFNLRFPLNFNSPYKAQSVIEYWQRWHMTLTRYLTLYLFNPLALRATRRRVAASKRVDRRGQASSGGFVAMVALPILITLALAGIWHGAGLTFLVFGLLHAAYLIANHAWRIFRPSGWKPRPGRGAIIRRTALTYGCVLVGSVVFRAPSLAAALSLLGGMLGLHGLATPVGSTRALARAVLSGLWLAALYGVVWLAPNTQQIMRNYAPALEAVRAGPLPWLAWRPDRRWAVAFGLAAAVGLASVGGTGEFLYFRF